MAQIKRHLNLALERARDRSSKPRDEFAILDLGCGRGDTVALLRENGWKAWGAEIDPTQASLAREGMRVIGHSPEFILEVSPEGVIGAPEAHFDFLFSEQVLEHVGNLDSFVTETWRVLKPGASAFHVFPARWRLVEPHIRQPVVHWLPDGKMRAAGIRIWVTLGVEAGALRQEGSMRRDLGDLHARGRSKAYAAYLRDRAFYRSQEQIERAFLQHFATIDIDIIGDRLAEIPPLSTVARLPLLRRLCQGLCARFYTSAIFLTKSH